MSPISYDILLDEDAFDRASDDFNKLSGDLEKIRGKLTELLDTLSEGYNTPAGRKLRASCEENLVKPINDQRIIIDQISQNLGTAKTQYQSVFDAYRDLNTFINNHSFQ